MITRNTFLAKKIAMKGSAAEREELAEEQERLQRWGRYENVAKTMQEVRRARGKENYVTSRFEAFKITRGNLGAEERAKKREEQRREIGRLKMQIPESVLGTMHMNNLHTFCY